MSPVCWACEEDASNAVFDQGVGREARVCIDLGQGCQDGTHVTNAAAS